MIGIQGRCNHKRIRMTISFLLTLYMKIRKKENTEKH